MMDQPLIEEGGSPTQYRAHDFYRHSVAITRGSRYQKAAALVDLAEDGIGLPEEILDDANFESAAKFYFFYIQLDIIWKLNYFALIVLNFLEKPLWCGKQSSPCDQRNFFYLGQLPYLSTRDSVIFEAITLVVLSVHVVYPITYEGFRIYWKHLVNKIKVVFLLILVVDFVVYVLYLSPFFVSSLPLRFAPYIRVSLFVLSIRVLRECMFVVAGMIPLYLNILALLFLFLLFSSWVAYVVFEDSSQQMVFSSYGATLYQMFILFTTSNNPDVWIPAYKDSRWYAIFFVLYVIIGVYLVTNLILAVVYDSFRCQLVQQVISKDRIKKSVLKKSFSLLDNNNVGYLEKEQCILLFEALNKYRSLPKISRTEFGLIFDSLDDTRDFQIKLDEYYDLCSEIASKFHKQDVPSYLESFPMMYHSPLSEQLKCFVRSSMFDYIVSVILLLNLVAVVIETTLDVVENSSQKAWQLLEFIFGWIYVVEMILKVYSYGFLNYWRDGGNRFDSVITVVIVIGETATFAAPGGQSFLSNGEWIRYLQLCRILRLARLLMYVKRYKASVSTFLTLVPTLMPYLGVIFSVLCLYCSVGVQIFGGLVNAGNSILESTDLYDSDYLLFNFNDYPNGMVTLFNLLVMGNWQAWMSSYKELSGSSWSIIYFVSFYLITIMLLLNLVLAFVLEAFFVEMEIEKSDKDERKPQTVRSRAVGAKTMGQKIDVLLHSMLREELNETQTQG